MNDDRIVTIVEETTYTIIVKNLRLKEDDGVYTLKSPHLIIDTPLITVVPEKEKPDTDKPTVEEDEATQIVAPEKQQPRTAVEEKKDEQVSDSVATES